jgi:hypothetical protein
MAGGELDGNGLQPTASNDSMLAQTQEFPSLPSDEDSQSSDIENAAREDISNFKRSHKAPAKTVFHQRRGDDDTM